MNDVAGITTDIGSDVNGIAAVADRDGVLMSDVDIVLFPLPAWMTLAVTPAPEAVTVITSLPLPTAIWLLGPLPLTFMLPSPAFTIADPTPNLIVVTSDALPVVFPTVTWLPEPLSAIF